MKKGLLALSIGLLLSTQASSQIEKIAQDTATACSTILKAQLITKGCLRSSSDADNSNKGCSYCTKPKCCAYADDANKGCNCGVKPKCSDDADDDNKCGCGVKPKSADDVADDNKCGCGVKPKSADDVADDNKCGCGVKPKSSADITAKTNESILIKIHYALLNQKKKPYVNEVRPAPHAIPKENTSVDGGELFVKGAANILQIVQGGITANNTGKLEAGLPYIFNGIGGLTALISRSANPDKAYNELFNYMQNLNETELARLLNIVRSQSLRNN